MTATHGSAEQLLASALHELREVAAERPSRELSLAITNAQQAQHWLQAAIAAPRQPESAPR